MPIRYSVVEIHTAEAVRCRGSLLYDAVKEYIRSLKIPARCVIFKGVEGVYESGEVVTQKIMDLSCNMPMKIEIFLPSTELPGILPALENMVSEGIIGVRDMEVICHKTRRHLFPRQIRVRDVMTPSPKSVAESDSVDKVLHLLLSAAFTGVPVVNTENRPVGIISQGDLMYRAKMPLRLALMSKTAKEDSETLLHSLSRKKAEEIMTRPAVCIHEDELLTAAVNLMLEKNVKRLPVTDAWGRLSGILSRMDIFQTITRESPDWESIRKRNVIVEDLRFVSDIMRRDTHTVGPDTSVDEVIRIICSDDIQRVAVVDAEGKFLGIISDSNLLAAFSDEHPGIWEYLTRLIPFSEKGKKYAGLSGSLRGKTAKEVMRTDPVSVREDAPIEEAIALITEKGIKRLPVLDADGKFKGMISRESLLRSGFTQE